MARQSNISIDQGSDTTIDVLVTDNDGNLIDLTSSTAQSEIRKHYSAANSISFNAVCNVATSTIVLTLTANQTANVDPGRYVYDVILINNALIYRVVEGICTIRASTTH